jgi:rhamnosyltransferase subunit B
LGEELRARGHEVTLAANEDFAERATDTGIGFCSLVSNREFEQVLGKTEFWHPIKGPVMMARWGAQFLSRQYDVLTALAMAKPTILVASPGVLAARVIQEKSGVPLAGIILQPWMVPSEVAPPVMMGGLTLPRRTPRMAVKIYFRLLDGLGGLLMGRELNRLRGSLGLKRVRRMFRWWLSPELVIGLFPEWYGEPQPDWPRQLKLAGFPSIDGQPNHAVPDETVEFCRAGRPPITFTFGTGMMHAATLFDAAIAACRMLGARAILLTKFRSQLPGELPGFVHHCEFAPFQKLFPLCAAVVHHGGIGTVAKALAAGTPQLILPFAWDQLDNALRVKKLGAGDWLKPRQRGAGAIAAALKGLLNSEAAAQPQTNTARFGGRSGIQCATDLIEEFCRERNSLKVASDGRT